MPRQPSKTFTDKELEIMRVVWKLGEASARQIQEKLAGDNARNAEHLMASQEQMTRLIAKVSEQEQRAARTVAPSPRPVAEPAPRRARNRGTICHRVPG